jgi:hypothetical protein
VKDFIYNITVKDNHILVTTDGICTTIKQIMAYGNEIQNACKKEKLDKVLIDDRKLTIATSFFENFHVAEEVTSVSAKRNFIKIAQVANKANFEKSKVMETIFRNRGLDLKVFDAMENAHEWLLG